MANTKLITFDQLHSALTAVKEYAAQKEHGTHVIYSSTTTDIVPGEQAVAGSANSCAKGDHTHSIPPYPTELKSPGALTISFENNESVIYDGSANKNVEIPPYPTELKSPGVLTISFANDDSIRYDGSANENIEISYNAIGAAPTYHSSNEDIYGKSSDVLYGHAKASSTTPREAGTANIGTETSSFARGDHVHPAQVNITGNASTATKLISAASITIGDTSKPFDGSSGVSWSMSDIGIEYATDLEVSVDVNNIFS